MAVAELTGNTENDCVSGVAGSSPGGALGRVETKPEIYICWNVPFSSGPGQVLEDRTRVGPEGLEDS